MIRPILTLSVLLLVPGISFAGDESFLTSIDKTADPCADFFQYACGNWLATNEIPPDQSRWGRFPALIDRNRAILRGILDKAAVPDANRDAVTQKIGDFYSSCMDEKGIESKGAAMLQPELDRIETIRDAKGIAVEAARLHMRDSIIGDSVHSRGTEAFFEFGSDQDFKDSEHMIAALDQGGLGLPDRDQYFDQNEKAADARKKYAEHMSRMFQLLGDKATQADAEAKIVFDMETAIASNSLTRSDRRDPEKLYHMMTRKELASLAPSFQWEAYFSAAGAPEFASLNVTEPEFFKGLDRVLRERSLSDIKTYLKWHLVHADAEILPAAFVAEDYGFYRKYMQGQQEIQPRWKRCVIFTDKELGEALGQAYVAEYFPPENKERMLKMVGELKLALKRDLDTIPWMADSTKKRALEKLAAMTEKIGYPDAWRDYTSLRVERGDALGDFERSREFEARRELGKIGKQVDKKEWNLTPPTVNAYYHPMENNVNFPAGILQPPFFDASKDDAVDFGAIGAVIGHEMTHGFDDEGRKFDSHGNLADWWTPEDGRSFEKRASCLVDEYSSFIATADVHLSGKLTLGENTADSGGVRLALMALEDSYSGKSPENLDGFTPRQRFFLAFANVWCMKQKGELSRILAKTDPHSPAKYRVNGVLSNMSEFQEAFGCKDASPMVRKDACRVW